MTFPNPGPANATTGNVAGGPYAAFSGTNTAQVIGPAGVLVNLGGGGGGGVALYDGANSITSGTAQFSNSNGVSFGFNAQTITASISTSQSVQTQASGAIAGSGFTSTTTAGTAVVGTHNSAGLSLGIPVYITTFTPGGAQTGISSIVAGGSTQTVGMLSFANSNGVTFGLSTGAVTGTITASVTAANPGISSIADAANTQTVGMLSFANSNGITFGLSTGANTATLTASFNSAGLLSNINISGGASSANVSAVTFSNANGVTFGYDKTNVTASINSTSGAGLGTTFAGTNVSGSITLNTAGLNLALSAQNAAAGAPTTVSWYQNIERNALGFTGASASFTQVNSIGLQPFQVNSPLTFYRAMALESITSLVSQITYRCMVSNSQGSTGGTASIGSSFTFGLYSRVSTGTNANSSNIISFASTSWTRSLGASITYSNATNVSTASATMSSTFNYGWQLNNLDSAGNATSSATGGGSSFSTSSTTNAQSTFTQTASYNSHLLYMTGLRAFDIPMATYLSPGEYWAGIQMSTNSGSTGIVSGGAGLMSFSQGFAFGSMTNATIFNVGILGSSSNANTYVQQGMGKSYNTSLTSTTFPLSAGTDTQYINTYYAFMAQTK